ncbi:MAG: site-2 protease family protein [Defluviitaleaceae bacterium]|nr:site-2 protease family protein [Defluviitaleaceae bacterium]
MRIYSFLHYVCLLPAAFFAPVIHESVKALCTSKLGDPTPKNKGFLKGNPFRYFEAVGFICILIFGYGWGQPVPTSPVSYRDRKRGTLVTYITPSVVNLLVGVIAAASGKLFGTFYPMGPDGAIAVFFVNALYLFAKVNISLALFNIIPVYPLDGAKVLSLFLKPDLAIKMNHYEKILQVILILLLGFGLVGRAFDPLVDSLIKAVWL